MKRQLTTKAGCLQLSLLNYRVPLRAGSRRT